MSFMNAVITDKQYWLMIDGDAGTEYIPDMLFNTADIKKILDDENTNLDADLLPIINDYVETSRISSAELVYGYGVRSSAAGYMDCTSWSVYTNKREAESAARQKQRKCEGKD